MEVTFIRGCLAAIRASCPSGPVSPGIHPAPGGEARRPACETFGRGKFVFPRPAYISEAKRAIERSVAEAQALAHDYVGTEHMLLGLLGPDEAPGSRLVRALGLDPAEVRGAVLARITG